MFKRILIVTVLCAACAVAQPPAGASGGRGRGPQAPPVMSPEVSADRQVTFRLSAPQAQSVRISGGDIPNINTRGTMSKGPNGVWEVTVGPLDAGAYRYNFNVDGLTVVDPRNGAVSESLSNVWSLVVVPGSDYFDTKEVPHGAVAGGSGGCRPLLQRRHRYLRRAASEQHRRMGDSRRVRERSGA